MYDQHLTNAAKALAQAIGNRWTGWYAVTVGRDPDGKRVIHVSFDRDHVPALAVNAEYNGYLVRLRPTERPADVAAAE